MIEIFSFGGSREQVIGNIFIRTMYFPKTGDFIECHAHNFDHVTYVLTGGILVKYGYDHKTKTCLNECVFWAPKPGDRESGKTNVVLIKKGVCHEIVAVADTTHCHCVFSHRDPRTGEVIDEANGWTGAYL